MADDSASDSDIEECSGFTQPTLLQQIKTILDEYRNDVQIIKELVQNADDAEASKMGILYQSDQANDVCLDNLKFEKFLKAPALVFYNNAEFTAADWDGIKAVYSSVKKDDPLKIGRFGLGFKAVFHMTDNPCILSGENVLFIDPHQRRPDKVCTTVKLKSWNKPKHRCYFEVLKETFGFSEEVVKKGRYPGTLFWFSLRKAPSTLSQNTYAEPEVLSLLKAFINESNKSLLFLKTLCSVRMYVNLHEKDYVSPPKRKRLTKDEKSQAMEELHQMNFGKKRCCFSVALTNETHDLVVKKAECLKDLKKIGHKVPKESVHWVFDVTVQTESLSTTEGEKVSRARWLLVNYLKGGEISDKTKELMEDEDLRYLHLVGLAAPIEDSGNYRNDGGQVFCYQPLPCDASSITKLPVHLNAFFALSQNRRQIRWPDKDDITHALGDKKIEWNIALTSEMFPEGYQNLVANLVKLSKKKGNPKYLIEAVYNAIPRIENLEEQWKEMAETYISNCNTDTMLYTELDQGHWISAVCAIFADFRRFPDVSKTCQQTILSLLMLDKINVVSVPDHVTKSLGSIHSDLKYVTPTFVKEHLKKFNSYKKLTLDQKQDLLEFICLESSGDSLFGLELLPLANDTFAKFSAEGKYFLESQDIIDLFTGQEKKFILANIRPKSESLLLGLCKNGMHGVHKLTADTVVAFLRDILCSQMDGEKKINKPLAEVENLMKWVRSIWLLIQSRFKTSMRQFESLPIFPVSTDFEWVEEPKVSLLPLESAILYIPSLKKMEDNEHIYRAFNHLSVAITDNLPKWLDYNLVHSYLSNDSDGGLISLFAKLCDKNIEKFNTESSDVDAAVLLKYVSVRIHADVKDSKHSFQKLKMFKGYISENDNCRVTLKTCSKLYVGRWFPASLAERMIYIKDDMEASFAKRLGVMSISECEAVKNVLNTIENREKAEIQDFFRWIIEDGTNFLNEEVEKQMKHVRFLSAEDECLYKPCELFDPSDKPLEDLFQGKPAFPLLGNDNDPKFTKGLRKPGLKSKNQLTIQDLENVCSDVHNAFVSKKQINKAKCLALLSVMNEMHNVVKKDTITQFRCIMVKKCHDESYPTNIPMKNRMLSEETLCFPSEIKSSEFRHLVGSVLYTINCKPLPHLSKIFSWQEQPATNMVLEHLKNVVSGFQVDSIAACHNMIFSIYKWLAEQYDYDRESIRAMFRAQFVSLGRKCIWVGDSFQAANNVYIEDNKGDIADMKPFLHRLPPDLHSLAPFFVGIGCQSSLSLDMYLDTLSRIKEETEGTADSISHYKLRKLAVAILNKLHEDFLEELLEKKREIFFPVIHEDRDILKMKPMKQCTFCDAQWLKDMELEMDEDISYVHPEVPITTAEALGVPSLRQQMLTDTEAFEEWGQEEPLTRRLRNLLKDGYVDGFSVAKELFQNADDAGASTLSILYDERENNDAKTQLISDGMAECQGPAIWVYNDAKFTEEDFKNITKLSAGTKLTDSTKIGKFGLGFCAVYNITDVPSFVSGDNVVIFDPHTTFLGKALPGKSPGLRINFKVIKNLKMMKRLKNQFKPFDGILKCRLVESVAPCIEGTLFRLPLRNRASDISDTVYSTLEVRELFRKIIKMAANMMLFNQNVKELTLYHLPKGEKDPYALQLLYKAEKESINIMTDAKLSGTVLKEASKRKQENTLGTATLSLIERVKITVQTVSDFQASTGDDKTIAEKSSNWLVSWATGSSDKSLRLTYDESGAINLGAVAVPIKILCSNEELDCFEICNLQEVPNNFFKEGHLFFFLPLPISHTFPFHVNSQFAVTTDRRRLQVSTEDDKNVKTQQWNESLFEDPITCALLYLLENLPNIGSLQNYVFHQLWPDYQRDKTLDCLLQSFYQNVTRVGLYNVFQKDGTWIDISECVFIENEFRNSYVGDKAFEFLSMLTQFVIDIPLDIYKLLSDANTSLIKEKTVTEERFFLEYFLPKLETFAADDIIVNKRNALLRYALLLESSSVKMWLKTNKSIPSSPNGEFSYPSDLVDPKNILAGLFYESEGRFPTQEFSHSNVLIKLRSLGLMTDLLPDNLVIERARSIETVCKTCSVCAAKRSSCLLAYLCDQFTKHHSVISELKDLSFIPVMCKPYNWPFRWFAECCPNDQMIQVCGNHKSSHTDLPQVSIFVGASGVYHRNSKNIVGCVVQVFEDSLISVSKKTKIHGFLKAVGIKGIRVEEVDTEIVIKQLKAAASDRCDKSKTFREVISDIYCHLEKGCTDPINIAQIHGIRNQQIVLVKDTFVYPKDVARNLDRDCKPHFYSLSESYLNHYPNLCHCLEINDNIDPIQFVEVFQNIKKQKGNTALSSSEINTYNNLLTCFVNGLKSRNTNVESYMETKNEAIFGPDENGFLRDCKTMCFNDFDDIEKSTTMIYAHEDFTPRLAKELGVKPKVIQNLEENSEDIEDFYQEEPLVTRLQRLVEGYPCDSGIFKELLQNADDAKATEIVFLKDYTCHPVSNIVDQSFKPLQGPALCVFNDSPFTIKDLKGIQKLGRGSKSNDPSQTGRYGVGFNAVYNLTDAPSFFTKGKEIENGETICFFDPLAKFVPKVTRKRPGKRYKNVNLIKRHHGDMLRGYHEQIFMPGEEGTVFRFPLRTEEMAKSSDIKKTSINMDTLSEILESFCNELTEVVLFLKHLKTIKVLTFNNEGYVEDYCINMQMTVENQRIKDELTDCTQKLYQDMKNNRENVLKSQQKSFAYELSLTAKTSQTVEETKYIIVQTLGFKKENGNDLPPILTQEFLSGRIGLSPNGGIAFCAGNNVLPEKFHWDHDKKCKAFCFLPLPIYTGLPVHVHGYFSLDHESRRSLWEAEKAELCYRTLWNCALIELVIAAAYVKFLEYVKEKMFQCKTGENITFTTVSRTVSNYQSLFPVLKDITGCYWKRLACCVYKELVKRQIPFLPCQEVTDVKNSYARNTSKMTFLSWTPLRIDSYSFPAYVMKESLDDESIVKSEFNSLLRRVGMRIVFVSEAIKESMTQAEIEILPVGPRILIDFVCTFKSSFVDKCKIETGVHLKESVLKSLKEVALILEFCLQDKSHFFSRLSEIPLMVTQDNFIRTLPDDGYFYIEPTGRFCSFFSTKLHLFLNGTVGKLLFCKFGDTLRDIRYVRMFSLCEFASLIRETEILQECHSFQHWDQNKPTKVWVKLFWDFFYHLLPKTNERMREVIIHQLEPLWSLPLIPAIESESTVHYLVPPCDIKRIIDYNSFDFSYTLQETLRKLNIMQIDAQLVNANMLVQLNKLVPNESYPQDVSECLHINRERMYSTQLSTSQALSVLMFFKETLHKNNTVKVLYDLPLFESCFGELVPLSKHAYKVVLADSIPTEGLKELAETGDVLLLKDNGLTCLFQVLGIQSVLMTEVYENFILPNQDQMSRPALYKHIEFLSKQLIHGNLSNQNLISVLRNIPFIEIQDKTRVQACDLFDPSRTVFKDMCEESELVPVCLREKHMLKFLRLLGLKHQLTLPLFEKFARKIEALEPCKPFSKEILRKSELLLSHLLEMNDKFYYDESFGELRKIRFIVPYVVDRNLSNIHKQFSCQRLICFEQSVLISSQHTSWTVASILPEKADPSIQNKNLADVIIEKFRICKDVDLEKLVKHCGLIGKSLGCLKITSIQCHNTIGAIMTSIYQALDAQKMCGKLTEETAKPLEDVPIIYFPETKSIYPAKRVVNICKDGEEIQPFLNRCPSHFAQFQDLFLTLGSKKESSCEAYISVLFEIKSQLGMTGSLLPKENSDCKRAMEHLYKYLSQQTSEIKVLEDRVFLLSENETLETAEKLVLANNTYYQRQIEKNQTKEITFLFSPEKIRGIKLEECIDSLKHFPQKHRPHLLTDLVRERINLANIVRKGGDISNELEAFFHSRYFMNGFLRIIRHAYKTNNIGFSKDHEQFLIKSLKDISFLHASNIKTTLALLPLHGDTGHTENLIENTEESKPVHLEMKPNEVCIYFDSSEQKWFSTMTKMLTVYLNSLTNKCLRDGNLIILMEIIGMKDSPEGISMYLSKEKIEEYQTSVEIKESLGYPIPGTFVPKELHQYLDNDYGVIHEYDYKFIAFELEDPVMEDADGDTDDEDRDTEPIYIFIHIIRKLEPLCDMPLFQEFEIDDGSEIVRTVKAYQLFKFVRKETTTTNTKQVSVYNSSFTSTCQNESRHLKEVYREVKQYLLEAWKKPEEERRKIVKRLLLKWHPDKNPNNVEFCTKVFQYIQQCIHRLEKGEELLDDEDSKSDTSNWSSSWSGRYWSRYEGRRSRRRYNRNFTNFDQYWSFRATSSMHTDNEEPYHWYSEARRWMKQAVSDLRNAEASMRDTQNNSCNWICYKAHQGAEKSLKAAWYAEDANKLRKVKYSHNISQLAGGLSSDIQQLANRLSMVAGDHSRMRYPDMFTGHQIPAEAYTIETALEVIKIANEIVKLVQTNHIK